MVMALDRKGKKLHLGDIVHLIPGMRVGRNKKAMVTNIDGENIRLDMWGPCRVNNVHRYGSEMEIVRSIWH
jgi:hypothetical protein